MKTPSSTVFIILNIFENISVFKIIINYPSPNSFSIPGRILLFPVELTIYYIPFCFLESSFFFFRSTLRDDFSQCAFRRLKPSPGTDDVNGLCEDHVTWS